jgi:hypothetical protein
MTSQEKIVKVGVSMSKPDEQKNEQKKQDQIQGLSKTEFFSVIAVIVVIILMAAGAFLQ